MRRRLSRLLPAVAVAAASAIAPRCGAAASGPEWLGFETPHFVIYSQVPPRHAKRVFGRLHLYMQAMPIITNLPARAPTIPTRIFLLDEDSFARVADDAGRIDGLFSSDAFSGDIVIDASSDTESSLSVIQHEFVHFSIRNAGVTALPAFYEEGLAQFVQSFGLSDRNFVWGFFPGAYRRSARSEAMPLARLIAIRTDSDEYTAEHSQETFYARSLLLLHYCLLGNKALHGPLMRMVARLADGEPEVTVFTEEFGMSPEAFDSELDAYLAKHAEYLFAQTAATKLDRESGLRERTLAPGEAELAYGNLLLATAPRDAGLVALFEGQLQVAALRDRAIAGLASALSQRGDEPGADTRIAELAALPFASTPALLQAGQLLLDRASRLATADPPLNEARVVNTLRRARSFFEAVLQREPTSAEAAYGYGLTQIQAPDDLATSLQFVKTAYQASPKNAELAMLLAMHIDQLGDHEAAMNIMRAAVCGAVSHEFRQFARRRLGPVRCHGRRADEPSG